MQLGGRALSYDPAKREVTGDPKRPNYFAANSAGPGNTPPTRCNSWLKQLASLEHRFLPSPRRGRWAGLRGQHVETHLNSAGHTNHRRSPETSQARHHAGIDLVYPAQCGFCWRDIESPSDSILLCQRCRGQRRRRPRHVRAAAQLSKIAWPSPRQVNSATPAAAAIVGCPRLCIRLGDCARLSRRIALGRVADEMAGGRIAGRLACSVVGSTVPQAVRGICADGDRRRADALDAANVAQNESRRIARRGAGARIKSPHGPPRPGSPPARRIKTSCRRRIARATLRERSESAGGKIYVGPACSWLTTCSRLAQPPAKRRKSSAAPAPRPWRSPCLLAQATPLFK